MAYATGTRLTAYTLVLIGAITLVGIPVCWPLGWVLVTRARTIEDERERELELLETLASAND